MSRKISSALRKQECLQACLDRLNGVPGLQAVLEEAEPKIADRQADAIVRLERKGTTQRYVVECLLRPTLEEAHIWRTFGAKARKPLLLCTPAMPKPLAQNLREEDQEFVDAAGNMFLDASFGLIWIQGLRNKGSEPAAGALLGTTGLKLVSVLLRSPEAANWSYRVQAEAAGVSLGMVDRIVSTLRTEGFLQSTKENARPPWGAYPWNSIPWGSLPRGGSQTTVRRLTRALDLLALWETGYAQRLRSKLRQGSFRLAADHGLDDLAEAVRREPESFLVGGELGAALLLGGLRPETATLHIRIPWREAAVRLHLLPDPKGPVTLLNDFGRNIPGPLPGLAHPLFLRAELLLGRGRRLADAAETILREHLEPALRDYVQG